MINVTQTYLPPLEDYVTYLERIWESKWLTNRGELVRELEAKLEDFLEIENLLLVNNGTIALQIAIKALELAGEIITTPFSYVATVSSIVWENCTPVFVDIDPDYLTIDERKIEDAITERTTAILATHVYGNPCNVEAIEGIAARRNLKVIYDAAHCFGVKYHGKSVLKWGDVSTLSLHATKLFHTGEGGAIISRDKKLADRILYHHNFGHNGYEEFFGLGINGKISELNAAIGLALLPCMDEILATRKAVCEAYDIALTGSGLQTINLRKGTEWNYSYYPVIFPGEAEMLKAKEAMNEAEIFPRRYFYPSLNRLPYVACCEMPVTENISRRVLCLPLSTEITSSDVTRVASIAKKYV